MKRRLLLGRKAVTNLDSILKSTDITLPTKVCLVKVMVFPVVMYGCESWTVKKAEHRIIYAFFFFKLYIIVLVLPNIKTLDRQITPPVWQKVKNRGAS